MFVCVAEMRNNKYKSDDTGRAAAEADHQGIDEGKEGTHKHMRADLKRSKYQEVSIVVPVLVVVHIVM